MKQRFFSVFLGKLLHLHPFIIKGITNETIRIQKQNVLDSSAEFDGLHNLIK